jgi:chromosome partitioning protein
MPAAEDDRMARMTESCSVCGTSFEVQFRYQMEERDGGFSFYCSQKCLETSQTAGGDGLVTCDACRKHFRVQLVSQVLYVAGRRKYACSSECRTQVLDEARGVRLGDMADRARDEESGEEGVRSVQAPTAALAAQDADGIDETDMPPVLRPSSASVPPAARAEAEDGSREVACKEPPRAAEPVSLIPKIEARTQPVASKPASGRPATIFAVFNHKGGTGKTTTSVSIAAGLAMAGHRVLLVDTDAQGNVGVSLDKNADKSLYHVLVMGLPLKTVIQTVRENLDLVASNETLAAAELYLAGRQNRDRVLRDRLAPSVRGYDFVILDCSPSLSLMNQNALVCADNVLVPVACDYLSLVGVRQVIKTVRNVNQLLHHPVKIWGVLPTFYDARANICREAVETLQKHFGERCLPPIRSAIKVKEAPAHGQTIFEYAGASTAADDYRAVVDRLIEERETQLRGTAGAAATTATTATAAAATA